MTAKETAALVAGAAASVILLTVGLISREPPIDGTVLSASTEFRAGRIPPYSIYSFKGADGGTRYVRKTRKNNVDDTVYVDATVCAMRRKGSKEPLECQRIDGGDPGEENVMQGGEWIGTGCIPAPCVIFSGDAPPSSN